MSGNDLIDLMIKSHRRVHVVGTPENGIIAALDLEGRLFAVVNGLVINRVVPSSIINRTNRSGYLNPGGDALWPAPEGSCFGYEYSSEQWRVPPAITGAVWEVVEHSENRAVIRAEIDLINNRQLGIPCVFERHIVIEQNGKSLIQKVAEIIRYIGVKTFDKDVFRLAPWSLCQFDSGKGCQTMMPLPAPDDIQVMYNSSPEQFSVSGDRYVVNTETDFRFQLVLGESVPWIEYTKGNEFRIKRYIGNLPPGQRHIDISDVPPDQLPSDFGVSLSIYCDPADFMEIEACGGCPDLLVPGTELSVNVTTEYTTTLQ